MLLILHWSTIWFIILVDPDLEVEIFFKKESPTAHYTLILWVEESLKQSLSALFYLFICFLSIYFFDDEKTIAFKSSFDLYFYLLFIEFFWFALLGPSNPRWAENCRCLMNPFFPAGSTMVSGVGKHLDFETLKSPENGFFRVYELLTIFSKCEFHKVFNFFFSRIFSVFWVPPVCSPESAIHFKDDSR